ncbi:DUF262 domain-containing protein [Flavobacterium sp. GN10]|uniref:DUF262 domain-containing protein n=1 Tax=Flavobacterium tagetis TaxID=2801336 RepID=A0ABS1KDU1_9FLAO|nr:DUF262 domain-containing protein [Flavobacterium tagetis]MBL0736837.1 DUF262 domain-containing protein [Flavobacterium tagetis]
MNLDIQLNDQKRKVDFNTFDLSVKELVSMFNDGIIDIAPEYQRQFRWKDDRQSNLIESIFLGIPIPSLFMATNPDNTWELIDGVQRLSSIIRFCGDQSVIDKLQKAEGDKITNLKLSELNKLTSFNNKKFSDLPRSIQLDFLLKPLKVITLSDKSDLSVRFDLFERLNTGGISLTDQEIRSCIYRGKFNDFLKTLSSYENFKKTVILTNSMEMDGTREEFVLRFFAFLNNYENFDHSVVDFLNDYMMHASKSNNFNYSDNEALFKNVFDELSKIPNGISRKQKTTPVNLFEAVAVGAALAFKENGSLNLNDVSTWMISDDLRKFTTGATNTKSKVKGRIEFCQDKFSV